MSKADRLGVGSSFSSARTISARRAATAAATEAPTEGAPDPIELPTEVISHNPENPRETLRGIDELAATVSELGLINAITVARVSAYLEERPDRAHRLDTQAEYVVVDGRRRLEACRRAGETPIKVRVDDARVATDETLLETAFVANFHSDNMTDLEQAHALDTLVKFYGSQSTASKRLGISQPNIASKLSLLRLTPELQAELADGRRKVEHVRNLGKLSPDEQRAAADARAEKAAQRTQKRSKKPQPSEEEVEAYHGVISEEADRAPSETSTPTPSSSPPAPSAATPSSVEWEQEKPRSSPDSTGEQEPPFSNREPKARPQLVIEVEERSPHSLASALREHLTEGEINELISELHS